MGGRSFGHLLVFGALVGAARAAAAQTTLLVESYVGERPADADRVLAPLRDRLQRRGAVTTTAAMTALLGGRLPRPAATEPALAVTELTERIDLGFKSALRGEYQLAVSQLEATLEAAHESAGLVASIDSSRVWLTRALAGLAFARGRLGDPAGAAAAMAEQIRSLPEQPVTRDVLGPEVEKLYRTTRRALEAGPRGSLRVEVDEPGAQIYINEISRGHGRALARGLFPGTYRVLVLAAGIGRRYTAAVRAGEATRLSIDWDTDARLTVTPRWVGFVWPRDAPPRTTQLVHRIARRGAIDGVIVIGIAGRGPQRIVAGRAYRGTGAIERAAWIELGADAAARLAALADYLASGERAGEAIRIGEPRRAGRAAGWRVPVWGSAGVAAAAFAGGAYLLDLDGRSTCGALPIEQCPRLHDTALLGWTLIGAGVAAITFGAYRYTARGRPPAPSIVLGGSGARGFVALAWSF